MLHDLALQDTIQSVNGGVIVSVPAWDPEAEAGPLQVVRASPKMYNGVERYDYVSFQRPDRCARSYGHLRLLFKAVSKISPDGSHTTEAVSHEYAYMRMYEGAPANGDDKLAQAAGCMRIKPDSRYNRAWYEVIPLDEILARDFVVAVPNKPGVLHVSSFMPY